MENHLKTISETEDHLVVGNYIVLFGGNDIEGERFAPDVDLESDYTKTGRIYVDWEHGLDGDRSAPKRDNVLGYVDWATAKTDERGLWVQRVLNRRNEYMRYIEPLIRAGLVGNSSEAVPELVNKTADGTITRWGLHRDTLTVNPAETRMMTENVMAAMKSLGAMLSETKTETKQMAEPTTYQLSDEQLKSLIAADRAPVVAPNLADDPAMKAINDQMNQILEMLEKSAPMKDAGYIAPDSTDDHANSKSFGDFLIAVRNKNTDRLTKVYKTALAEGAGSTGGYLVPTEYGSAIIAQLGDLSVLRRAGATVVPMARKSREIPVLDIETAPSAGDTAFAGGVIAYYAEEAGTVNESEPRFRLIELVAHKLMAYSLASAEVRDDAAESIDGLMATMFARAFASKENYNFFRGDGVGKPFGILNSGAVKAASRSAANAVALDDLAEMISYQMPDSINSGRLAWFINPAVLHKLIQLVSSPLSWMENLRQGLPVTLMGWPVYICGALPGLNTAGDIMLVDPSYYLIGDRNQIEIAISEHYRFANDQLAWRATMRHDGQPWINNAVTLENASTTVSPFVTLAAG